MRRVILTPVAKNYKRHGPDSKRDYEEQEQRAKNKQQIMWDDAKQNKASVGDIFCFVKNNDRVMIHLVIEKKLSTERLPSWSHNVGQTDRQVLYLSVAVDEITWAEWLDMDGCKKVQGTMYVARETLINSLTQMY
jgi:hypothetical protein